MNSLQAAWKEEKEALLAQREEIQAEALARLGAFQQEKEERLIQCRKEYEGRVERLRKEYEGKLAKYRDGYEQQLAQAKQQYNELAETAVKLQQIGRKWRDKYIGKDEETYLPHNVRPPACPHILLLRAGGEKEGPGGVSGSMDFKKEYLNFYSPWVTILAWRHSSAGRAFA